jgi:apolipoprotein N-acyltransferase
MAWARARQAVPRGRLQHPLAKYGLLPLVLAMAAFRLHQHIAYGGAFGELHTFGLKAYLAGFAIWWATWAMGVLLWAAALRTAIEAGTLAALLLRPARVVEWRRGLERIGLPALYLGLPGWLLLRTLGA